jgi:outer membrane protein OmpA-like peptidoglycan-associated protein
VYKVTKHALVAFTALTSIAFAGHARADDYATQYGPYVGIGAGVNIPQVSHPIVVAPSPTVPGTVQGAVSKFSFDTGYNITGALGYKSQSGLRGEAEFSFRRAGIDNVDGASWSGRQRVWSLMFNALYDINMGGGISPYVGAGIGVGRNYFRNVSDRIPGDAVYNGHDTNFQWQLIGGVSVPVAPQVAVFADYRYIRLNNNEFPGSIASTRIVDHDDRSHNVLLGVRIFFHKPEQQQAAAPPPPPPPPAPVAAAPPAPPPVPDKVLAFFDFDKATLRPDARQVVQQAADFAKSHNKTVISVTGYTDTMGTPEYNMALSKRRALAVKAELIKLGIPENEIHIAWKGEADLLVQTGDQVKEPQNRRVEIIYD